MGFSRVTCKAGCHCFNYGLLFKLQGLIPHPSYDRCWCASCLFALWHQSLSLSKCLKVLPVKFIKVGGGSALCFTYSTVIHSFLLCVFFFFPSGELLRLETRLIRTVGRGGTRELEGGVAGHKPKAMSLKKTLNSRGERTVEPAIISWQQFVPPTLFPLSRAIMGNTDQSIRVEIWLFHCYSSVITYRHDTYMLKKASVAVYGREMLIIMPSLCRLLLPLLPPSLPPSPALAVCHRMRRGWMVVVM